jgi:AraC-like DNA-binding protein
MPHTSKMPLPLDLPIRAHNAGFFVSRGQGTHPTRAIDSHELIFVRTGTLGMFEEKRRFDIHAGETLHLRPGRKHGGTEAYPPDLSFYWIHFTVATSGRTRSRRRPPELVIPQHARVARPDRLTELFRRFLDDQESGQATPLSAALLMALLLEATAGAHASDRAAPSDGRAALAARAEAWLLTRFQEPITASHVAAGLSCNPDYLGRVFRQVRGRTLTDAINRRRLQQARRLLLESAQNVDQVARASGFREAGYFRRVFRRVEGMTPLAFRRLYARVHLNTA